MSIEEWWPKLTPSAQEWLIANNGDTEDVPADVAAEIAAAGGPADFAFADDDVDWIETVANDESESDGIAGEDGS